MSADCKAPAARRCAPVWLSTTRFRQWSAAIETMRQIKILGAPGCDVMQGYHLYTWKVPGEGCTACATGIAAAVISLRRGAAAARWVDPVRQPATPLRFHVTQGLTSWTTVRSTRKLHERRTRQNEVAPALGSVGGCGSQCIEPVRCAVTEAAFN